MCMFALFTAQATVYTGVRVCVLTSAARRN